MSIVTYGEKTKREERSANTTERDALPPRHSPDDTGETARLGASQTSAARREKTKGVTAMVIDSIMNGVVIDHISAGKSMELYKFLGLDKLTCSVAIIKNAPSSKIGRKDIIKIDDLIDLDVDALGYLDPGVSVNIIKDGTIVSKYHPELPDRLVGVIRCKNPRCISQSEQELEHIFKLTDRKNRIYRCLYCESRAK